MKILRQGDVLMIKVKAIPVGAAEEDMSKAERVVLAYGEATGHAHVIERDRETGIMPVRTWSAGAERFIQVIEKTALTHEEHSPVPLNLGIYRVVHQREYSPSEIRRVQD